MLSTLFNEGSTTSVTGISSVAMQEGSSDVIEVRLAEDLVTLEVLLNQELLKFNRTWIDLKGKFICWYKLYNECLDKSTHRQERCKVKCNVKHASGPLSCCPTPCKTYVRDTVC